MTSSVLSGLLSDLAHVRQARLRRLRVLSASGRDNSRSTASSGT